MKNFLEKIKPHILYSVTFFSENRAVYWIIWKNVVEPDDNITERSKDAICMPGKKGKNTDAYA
jgi:hypothetical protein